MHLIIDGYNLLALRSASKSEMDREILVDELAGYRHRKGHAVTVVFDGWQQGQPLEGHEHRSGVHLIFSKRGEKADQVIQRLAREYGEDCAVVSSDREIANTARAFGALVIDSREFAMKLRERGSSGAAIPHKELDTGDDRPPRRGPEKKGNPRKLPKSQRQRDRQLKRF